jgi:predicted nucleotidyltransferase
MKAVGIICEYNPFHNGHLYHLLETKKMFKDSVVIAVMVGNFCQRGESSIINKWTKTKIALEHGIDLVIELPFYFATQSADLFSKGSIQILNHLKVDDLVFGSESNNLDKLIKMANLQIDNDEYEDIVKKYLDEGNNYPSALAKAINSILNEEISTPNDILGITYIREIITSGNKIVPHTIKRTNNYHSLELDSNVVSASSIRKALYEKKDVKNQVPSITYDNLNNLSFYENYFNLLKYKILSDINNLNKYNTVDEGIESRIKDSIIDATSMDDLIMKIKTKRYTYNKIRRMLTHILCNFTKEEAEKYNNIEYIRVLGFSKQGQKYLNHIKKDIEIPILSKFQKNNDLLNLELRSTMIYASIFDEDTKQKLINNEFKNNPIRKHQD